MKMLNIVGREAKSSVGDTCLGTAETFRRFVPRAFLNIAAVLGIDRAFI